MDNFTQVLEAILFASGSPRKKSEITDILGDRLKRNQFEKAIEELKEKYNGESGIVLLHFNDKYQLTTNTVYGETVAEVLTPLKEKELSRVLLEVLAIIAYKQPITKPEIERVKNSSAEYALSILLKTNLIEVVGRKDVVGRPVLYGTSEEFLKKFQLENLEQLPDFNAVLERLELLGEFNKSQVELYREIDIDNENSQEPAQTQEERLVEIERRMNADTVLEDILDDEDDVPDFLKGEEYQIIE